MWVSMSKKHFFFSLWHEYFKLKSKLKHIGEVKGKKETEVLCYFHLQQEMPKDYNYLFKEIQTALY